MRYAVAWQPYRRPFEPPLETHHGIWRDREGIIVTLTDAHGQRGQGEIAPIPWFGSETLAAALAFCAQLPPTIDDATIAAIPDALPACQMGFESAVPPAPPPVKLPLCGLLPAGTAALAAWRSLWDQGYRTFKWKIGVSARKSEGELERELEDFKQLLSQLPPPAQLRLDANGSLTLKQATHWLECCDRAGRVEYLEQPLPPAQFAQMQDLSQQFQTPLALDESVATLSQLAACYARGWRGIYVIKPAIVGSPRRLRQFCHLHPLDAVFSSAFETSVGRRAGLSLAAALGNPRRATGYGTTHWLRESAHA